MAPLSPRARVASVLDRLRSSLWPVPVALIAAAVGLALFTLWIDRLELIRGSPWWIFHGGPDGARSTLSSLATSIMTLAGVSISMTAVVLQLASNQFSPRVVRSFLRDLVIQAVVGVYVASFTFVVLVLRAIRSAEKDGLEFVAPLSVAVAILFGLLSVIVLVVFIDHIARSLQASAIVDRIAEETKDTIAHLYPDALGDRDEAERSEAEPSHEPKLIRANKEGYLSYVDTSALRLEGGVVAIDVQIGDFVRCDDVVARVWSERSHDEQIAQALVFAGERTMQQDVRFGFHLLADIALRALSPGINDPTTAVYCVNKSGDVLCRLVTQHFPPRVQRVDGACVIARRPSFEEIARVALEPIVVFGISDARVPSALLDVLDALEQRDARRVRALVRELRTEILRLSATATGWTERQRRTVEERCRRAPR